MTKDKKAPEPQEEWEKVIKMILGCGCSLGKCKKCATIIFLLPKAREEAEYDGQTKAIANCEKTDHLDFIDEAIAQERQRIIELVEKRLKYCQEQNGLPYCKNCGLCEEDLQAIKQRK